MCHFIVYLRQKWKEHHLLSLNYLLILKYGDNQHGDFIEHNCITIYNCHKFNYQKFVAAVNLKVYVISGRLKLELNKRTTQILQNK